MTSLLAAKRRLPTAAERLAARARRSAGKADKDRFYMKPRVSAGDAKPTCGCCGEPCRIIRGEPELACPCPTRPRCRFVCGRCADCCRCRGSRTN